MAALSWKHVVPWKNRSEFVQTYLDLYSKDADRQWKAVGIISVWKCRAVHKLAVAIESSAALTEVCLMYQQAVEAKELLHKDFSLRHIFSMVLVRFVNHTTEKGQDKAFAKPVHKIAEEFGIPDWIVRLRHDATHGSLPCLDMLTRAAQWALSYLQDVFWSQQVKEADECTDPGSRKRKKPRKALYDTEEIIELLDKYQKASRKSVEKGPESEAAREESRVLKRIEHVLDEPKRNRLLSCLVWLGNLLPIQAQFNSYHINIEETLKADPPKVPGILINVWKAVLRLIHEKQMTSLLLQHILSMMLKETDVFSLNSLMLAAWLRLILLYESSNFTKSAEERVSQPALYPSSIEFSKALLLYTCQQSFNLWACRLLTLVADPDSLSVETHRKLEELEKVYGGDTTTAADQNQSNDDKAKGEDEETKLKGHQQGGKIFTVEDLKNKFPDQDSIWKLCTEPVDWERVPLGVFPSEIGLPGLRSSSELEGHDYSSSSVDEGESSEAEAEIMDDSPTKDDGEESSVHPAEDELLKNITMH